MMKYLRSYKIFENNLKLNPGDNIYMYLKNIATDILLPLKDEDINYFIWTEEYFNMCHAVITILASKTPFDLGKINSDIDHLISTMESKGHKLYSAKFGNYKEYKIDTDYSGLIITEVVLKFEIKM